MAMEEDPKPRDLFDLEVWPLIIRAVWLRVRLASRALIACARRPSLSPLSTTHNPHAQAYIANYTGHTKIDRLVFIAERSAGKPLELEALQLAADDLKQVCCAVGVCVWGRCVQVLHDVPHVVFVIH